MNKKRKFTSIALASALFCGVAGTTFVGCKDYDDDIDNLHKEINDLKSGTIASMDTQIKGLTQGQTDLKSLITSLQTEVEALKSSKDAYVAADQALETRLKEAIKNGTDGLVSQDDLKATMAEVNAMGEKFAELDASFAQMLEDFENAFGPSVTAMSNRSIGDFATSLSKIIQALTDRVGEINGRVNVCEESIDTLKSQIEAINTQLAGKVDATDFEEFSTTTFKNIREVSDQLDKVREALRDSIGAVTSKIDQVQKQFTSTLGDYVSITVFNKTLDDRFSTLEAKLQIDSTAVAEQIDKLNELKTTFVTNENLKETLAPINTAIQELQAKEVTLEDLLSKTENQQIFDQHVNDLIKAALSDMGPSGGQIEGLDDLVRQVQANATAVSTLKTQYEALGNRVSNLENRIQSVVFIPETADKTVCSYSLDGVPAEKITVKFKVYPENLDLAAALKAEKEEDRAVLSMDAQVITRSTDLLTELEIVKGGEAGIWKVTAKKTAAMSADGYAAALVIKYKGATVSSDYFTIDNRTITASDITVKGTSRTIGFDNTATGIDLSEGVDIIGKGDVSLKDHFTIGYAYTLPTGTDNLFTIDGNILKMKAAAANEKGKVYAITVNVRVGDKTIKTETINVKVGETDSNTDLERMVLINEGTQISYILQNNAVQYYSSASLNFKYKIYPQDYTLPTKDITFDIVTEHATEPIIEVSQNNAGTITAKVTNHGWTGARVALKCGNIYSDFARIQEQVLNVNGINMVLPSQTNYTMAYNAATGITPLSNTAITVNSVNRQLSELGFKEEITYQFASNNHVGFILSADGKTILPDPSNGVSVIGNSCEVYPVLSVNNGAYTKPFANQKLRITLTTASSTEDLGVVSSPKVITTSSTSFERVNLNWTGNKLNEIANKLGIPAGNVQDPTVVVKLSGNVTNNITVNGVDPVLTIWNTAAAGLYDIIFTYSTTDAAGNTKIVTVTVQQQVKYEAGAGITEVPGWWNNNHEVIFNGQKISGVWNMTLNLNDILKINDATKGWSVGYDVKPTDPVRYNSADATLTLKDLRKISSAAPYTVNYYITNAGGQKIASGSFVVKFVDPLGKQIQERAKTTNYTGPVHEVSNAATSPAIELLSHLTWKDNKNTEIIDFANHKFVDAQETAYQVSVDNLNSKLYTDANCTNVFTDSRAAFSSGKFTWNPVVTGAEFVPVQLYAKLVVTTAYGNYTIVYPIKINK